MAIQIPTGETITEVNPINYVKNGVTTVLRKVIYRKAGVDTVVYNKTNATAVTHSATSASGGSTLNYYHPASTDYTKVIKKAGTGTGDYYVIVSGSYGSNWTGNTTFGSKDPYYVRTGTSEQMTWAQALSWVSAHSETLETKTAYSYYVYTLTARVNIIYAPLTPKTVKLYINGSLVKTESNITGQDVSVSASYTDNDVLDNRSATISAKVEVYDSDDTLLGTWTGTMAGSGTITYGDE